MAPQTRDYQLQNITFIVFMYQLTLKQKQTKFGINQSVVKTYENIVLQLVYFMMFDIFLNMIDGLFVNIIVSYLPDY